MVNNTGLRNFIKNLKNHFGNSKSDNHILKEYYRVLKFQLFNQMTRCVLILDLFNRAYLGRYLSLSHTLQTEANNNK